MDEFTEFVSRDRHQAEVAALQNEIYRLTKYISDTETERLSRNMTDPHDPFDNPTEYHDYHDDYTEIQPLISVPDYKPEFEPAAEERSNIKSCYAVGGWCNLMRFFLAYSLWSIIEYVVIRILESGSPQADRSSIEVYFMNSSIWSGMNMLIFGLTNVGFAFLGMRLSRQRLSSFLKTRGFTFFNFLNYSLIGFFLWYAAVILGQISSDIFSAAGIDINSHGYGAPVTGIGFAVYAVYTCVIAPVTEELFYRGMLLKVFSKSNQRFGIFFTALMFGLGHGNIIQFILGFIVGIFFAHITLKHNSIIPSITVHAVLNTMTVVLSSIEFTTYEEKMLINIEFLLAFAGMTALFVFRIRDKLPMTTPAQVRRGAPVAIGSIGVILATAVQVIALIVNIYKINM